MSTDTPELDIAEFDALDEIEADRVVGVWAAVPGWVDAVVAGRPYGSAAALAAYAGALADVWTRADLDAALAHHPRIGERPTGDGPEATASRSEQASLAGSEADVRAAIADGNAAYERRFGRVFLIRAVGRTPAEMLTELHRRLDNDDETEAREATAQLAEIALLRLHGTVGDGPRAAPARVPIEDL